MLSLKIIGIILLNCKIPYLARLVNEPYLVFTYYLLISSNLFLLDFTPMFSIFKNFILVIWHVTDLCI